MTAVLDAGDLDAMVAAPDHGKVWLSERLFLREHARKPTCRFRPKGAHHGRNSRGQSRPTENDDGTLVIRPC